MTPNEINFIKQITETLEKKNDKLIELSVKESQLKLVEVRDEWNKKYLKLLDKYDTMCKALRDKGYITDEVRKAIEEEFGPFVNK